MAGSAPGSYCLSSALTSDVANQIQVENNRRAQFLVHTFRRHIFPPVF